MLIEIFSFSYTAKYFWGKKSWSLQTFAFSIRWFKTTNTWQLKIWNFPDSQTGYSMFGAFLFGFLEGSSFRGGVIWFWAFCLVGWFWIFLVSLVYWFFPNRGMKPWGLILVKRNVSQNLKKRPEFQKVCSSMETNNLLVSFHPPADIKVIFFFFI